LLLAASSFTSPTSFQRLDFSFLYFQPVMSLPMGVTSSAARTVKAKRVSNAMGTIVRRRLAINMRSSSWVRSDGSGASSFVHSLPRAAASRLTATAGVENDEPNAYRMRSTGGKNTGT